MIILTHVVIAILGLAQATYGLIAPSRGKLRATYALTVATFVSGAYLVWHLHAPVLQSCETGLTYLALILAASVVTHRRLAHEHVHIDK
jgi:hypothetical protein